VFLEENRSWGYDRIAGAPAKNTLVASERGRPDIARRRAQWAKYQGRIKPERLIFIDETWTKTNMAPLRGWAPRGVRLVAKVPHGR
jgi:transposase